MMTDATSSSAREQTSANHPARATVFLFSGQGAQAYAMAKALFDGNETFRRTMVGLDRAFADALGVSLIERIYDPRRTASEPLDDILVSHPGTFAVQYAMGHLLLSRGVTPALVVGASLGEVTAAVFANVLSLDDAVALVAAQAQLFQRSAVAGGMVAILHGIDLFTQMDVLHRHSEIAAVNFSENFVVAADDAGLARIGDALRAREISFQRLPVRQPFHSTRIDPLHEAFLECCTPAVFGRPAIPMVSCAVAREIHEVDARHLWAAIREPIRTSDTIQMVEARGACDYVDIGPGCAFSNSVKRLLGPRSASRVHQPLSPFSRGVEAFEGLVATLGAAASPPPPAASVDTRPTAPPAVHVRPVPAAATAYLFPGQGSQKVGMGAGLFERFPDLTALADATLGYSIETLCRRDPEKQLSRTQFTQPALYVVNALTYFRRIEEQTAPPAFVAGHSLGEYNALLAAGAFDFATGLRLVKTRGELMSRASAGAMAAVIGCTAEQVTAIIAEQGLQTIDAANFNASRQIVVSGPTDDIRAAKAVFERHGARYVELPVSAPFHSRYMTPAVRDFEAALGQFTYGRLTCPVISNVTGRPYEDNSVVSNLAEQLRKPVRWFESMRYLIAQGVDVAEELGPGQVLTNLLKAIRSELT